MIARVWRLFEFVVCAFCACSLYGYYICAGENVLSNCLLKETCGECVRTAGCAWCKKPELAKNTNDNITLVRCINRIKRMEDWCDSEHIVDPESSYRITQSNPLSDLTNNNAIEDAVQLTPQRVTVTLRPGTEVRIPFQYKQALDYPIDLYYLMDLSKSMKDDKDNLSQLSQKMIYFMTNVTNNFRIGFGSFVEKPKSPFVNTRFKSKCSTEDTCEEAYSFRNRLSLTTDYTSFSEKISSAKLAGNIDNPECSFDAIMQVLICTDEIGWKTKARHLLIVATDASFHIAGDGKLLGIVEPNDEKCHLDASGDFTHSLEMDYPSVWQIDRNAKNSDVNIIFAVTQSEKEVYNELSKVITGASSGTLSKDSSNIIELLKNEYNKIVSSVAITDNASGFLEVQYYVTCPDQQEKRSNECNNIRGRPTLNFTAVIKATSCPPNSLQSREVIKIKPRAINEYIHVDVELVCDCPCENKQDIDYKSQSGLCSSFGSLQCGVCVCESGRYGQYCECDGGQAQNSSMNVNQCIPNTDIGSLNSKEICSGRGTCKCGKCDCMKLPDPEEMGMNIISGRYCQCDNFSCKRSNGILCSGAEKGTCECGECVCKTGWGGSACDCSTSNSTCIADDSDMICSGRGICECGSCLCSTIDNVRYSGRFCEECPSCPGQRCNELVKCVECQAYKTGPLAEDCESQCSQKFTVQLVDQIEEDDSYDTFDMTNDVRTCRIPDDSGCTIIFKYLYEERSGHLDVWAEKLKKCGRGVDVLAVVLGVVGSTVLAGIVILIVWKFLTTVHDRREFVKFETERRAAKWNEDNPLYKPSTTTFSNPTFQNQQ